MSREIDYNSLREKLNGLKHKTKEVSGNYSEEELSKSKYQKIRETLKKKDLGIHRGISELVTVYLNRIGEEFNRGNMIYAEGATRNISQVIASPDTPQENKLKYLNALNKRIDRGLKYLEKHPSEKNIRAMEKILDYSKMLEEDIKEPSKADGERYNKYLRGGLEKSLAVISVGAIIAGIFFLSPNLTGNVIGNLTKNSTNIFGGLLFILGILGAFFTLKK